MYESIYAAKTARVAMARAIKLMDQSRMCKGENRKALMSAAELVICRADELTRVAQRQADKVADHQAMSKDILENLAGEDPEEGLRVARRTWDELETVQIKYRSLRLEDMENDRKYHEMHQ